MVMLTLLWDAGEGGPGEEHHVGGDEGGRKKVDVGLFYSIWKKDMVRRFIWANFYEQLDEIIIRIGRAFNSVA